jgi:hypothetical protein
VNIGRYPVGSCATVSVWNAGPETHTGRSVNNPRDATELFIALEMSVDYRRLGGVVSFGASSCA